MKCGDPKDGCCPANCTVDSDSDCAELLDKLDNNGNGLVDEGYWAVQVQIDGGMLSPLNSSCTDGATYSTQCNNAISKYCQTHNFGSGFGPVNWDAKKIGTAICTADIVYKTGLGTEGSSPEIPNCQAGTRAKFKCAEAINNYCAKQSYLGGFGPVALTTTTVDVACVKNGHGVVKSPAITALTKENQYCPDSYNNFRTRECNLAVHRYCKGLLNQGHVTGFGPVAVDSWNATATVVCLNKQ